MFTPRLHNVYTMFTLLFTQCLHRVRRGLHNFHTLFIRIIRIFQTANIVTTAVPPDPPTLCANPYRAFFTCLALA